jgi:aldehyde:ferredoxin oxidoreductase
MEQIVRINLTSGTVVQESVDSTFLRKYMGGWGLIGYHLLKEVQPGIDPLSPDNKFIMTCGLLTGLPLPGAARTIIGAKSPLTGGFGASEVGGFFGIELRKAGIFSLIVEGRASEPVYICVNDGNVEIRPAATLAGRTTHEVEQAIHEECGDNRVRVAQAGIAGQNLVRVSCVIFDNNRAAGRGGHGAVMGSKNLIAIAVRGKKHMEMDDSDKIKELARYMGDKSKSDPGLLGMREHGTNGGLLGLSHMGGLPTRNFLDGSFEEAEAISGDAMTSTILVDRDTCWACPVRCKRVVEINDGHKVSKIYGGPEYETVGALGSCCGIGDLAAIAKGNELCNAYGLDTIGTGVTIAWAMECYEKGLLTSKDTDGLELRFGNADAMVKAVDMIAHRSGHLGALLAEGSWRASQVVEGGSEEFVMHCKKQEVPMHEPRIKAALAIGYATSPTGADHCHNIHDTGFATQQGIVQAHQFGIFEPLPAMELSPEKMRLAKYVIDRRIVDNNLGVCQFLPWTLSQVRDIVNAYTGWEMTDLELMKSGERSLAMARAFNAREGFTRKDDTIPMRFFSQYDKAPKDGTPLDPEVFTKALDLYYQIRNWNPQTGCPNPGLLYDLGLGWVVDLLEQ